jgi:O-antigen ligase
VIASLTTEGVSLGIPVTAPRILGYVFFLFALLQPRVCFRLPPRAFWWFGAYVYVFAVLIYFQPLEFWNEATERVFTLLQLMAFFWISCNLLRDPRVAREAILTLGVSCAVCAVFQLAGLAADESSTDRIATFGQNANLVASLFSLGLLAIAGHIYGRKRDGQPVGLWPWPLCIVLALAIVQTGSRGGLLAAGAGLLVLLFDSNNRQSRAVRFGLVALGAAVLVGTSYLSETNRQRWEESFAAGRLAHREQLYPTAWQMFTEKPLAGWGPITALYELGSRTKYVGWINPEERQRATHNLVLHVLTATGILGAIPFAIGTWQCVRAAWRGRSGAQGIVPLAMITSLIVSNLSGDRIYMKFHWLILAFAVASETQRFIRTEPSVALQTLGRPAVSSL